MKIWQFVHTLNYGDAISGEAIAIARLLKNVGIENRIFSLHAHEKVKEWATNWQQVRYEFQKIQESQDELTLILHYSIGCPLNDLFLELTGLRKVIIFHNLTPPHWFFNYNSRVVADLRRGQEELPKLCAAADLVLADSEYNRTELTEYGVNRDVQVLPLLLDTEKWKVEANAGIAAVLKGHGGKNILHVGRIAPNKCLEDIIKAFYFYHHKICRESRLWLVGIDIDTEIYSFELRRMVSEFRLKEAVQFVGLVADSELRAFYENSHAYLCMSEHEGFCVPLLEAMHFNLPIIAYDKTAVRETLDGAGLLLARKSPAAVAELIDLVCNDDKLRTNLISRGRDRVKQFELAHFAKQFTTLVLEEGAFAKKSTDGLMKSQVNKEVVLG